MPKEEEELDPQDLHLLKKELEASLQRIRFPEKENKQLRQELAFLKGQSTERKFSPWKKLQSSITNEGQPPVKAILQTKFQEQSALSFRKYDSSETSVVKERSPSCQRSICLSDGETQGEFIGFLTREVEGADYTEISDLEAFVKWLDDELSYLVDERAVLKHFPRWPERKADAMREAAFSYRDLKNLETEALAFQDNPHMPLPLALKRMQALQDKLEGSFHKVERMRESASKRYREFHIPWDWMLDNGMLGQLKLCSVRLARDYMKRIAGELQSNPCTQEEEDLLLQGVRFAFRVHQFVGGFDAETMRAFEVLAKTGRSYLAKSL